MRIAFVTILPVAIVVFVELDLDRMKGLCLHQIIHGLGNSLLQLWKGLKIFEENPVLQQPRIDQIRVGLDGFCFVGIALVVVIVIAIDIAIVIVAVFSFCDHPRGKLNVDTIPLNEGHELVLLFLLGPCLHRGVDPPGNICHGKQISPIMVQ